MLAVVLSVLKIVGITILVILAVALLLVLLVLFVPIRYKIDGNVPQMRFGDDFDSERIEFAIKFHWLLHILSGRYIHHKDDTFVVKIFGFTIYPRKEKPGKKKKRERKKDSETKIESTSDVSEAKIDDKDDLSFEIKEKKKKRDTDQSKNDTGVTEISDTDDEDEEKSIVDVVEDVISFVVKLIKTPQNVFRKIKYTISRVCGKINMIKSTLESEIFKRAYSLVKGKLLRLLKMIMPDKSSSRLCLGVGDPAREAEIMAAYGMMYSFLVNKLVFVPDFNEKIIEADIHLKGHITLFTVLYCVCVCYFNKDVKKVIARFKKIFER
ncbi:hypothetical protein D6853_03120 [Butyrivibrio sp. X503]|uniref:hypothetical protein n=1 Tax=Butyrivibrio sp. X503 TaxID=2364878 RepID=UPI000EAA3374|nr:hypothetical protein [Butyrivibrio sp. X503]RKM57024.1 hypothetical protein D6853_03120 [Butyrivibrio sp. X503]